MRLICRTHTKFASPNQTSNNDDGENPIDLGDIGETGDVVDDRIDGRPWKVPRGAGGIEIGEEASGECLNWMGEKVLDHAGFQGPSNFSSLRALKLIESTTCNRRDIEGCTGCSDQCNLWVSTERRQNNPVPM